MTGNRDPLRDPLRDRRMLILLFVSFRLMMLLVYQPFVVNGTERGLTVFGDFQHYYNLATLSDQGLLPYRDYWYEFPPIFPLISLAVYGITGAAGGFTAYATLLGLVMLAVDLVNIQLIMRLGGRLHNDQTGVALGWIYALMTAPLVFAAWTFEPLVACSFLFTLYWLVTHREMRAAAAIAIGALIKLFPLIALVGAWRFRSLGLALRHTVLAVLVTAVGVGAMLAVAGRFGVPSLAAQFNKASYQTVWALLDGNYKTGNFGPIADHFEPSKATELLGNPSRIPWWVRGAVFGAVGLCIFWRVRRFDARGLVAFVSITVVVFFLWSQGWSPQWVAVLLPLILLNFPTRNGVLIGLMLSLLTFVEYPLLFMRTAATEGAIGAGQLPLFTTLILARTALLVGIGIALYQLLRRNIPAEGIPRS